MWVPNPRHPILAAREAAIWTYGPDPTAPTPAQDSQNSWHWERGTRTEMTAHWPETPTCSKVRAIRDMWNQGGGQCVCGGGGSYHGRKMLSRYPISSESYRKPFLAIVLCLSALIAVPKASYSNVQREIQCTLTIPTSRAVSGQTISIGITVVNTSSQTLFAPWSTDTGTRHLLEWGVLSLSIEDESGNTYKYGPLPAPFFPRQKSHYHGLAPGSEMSNSINLCWFRDKHNSQSPCSRPGKYVVRATYANSNAEYWDAEANHMMELNEVWTGSSMCNEIKVEVVVSR